MSDRIGDLDRAGLLALLRDYDAYIRAANADDRYRDGWRPLDVAGFFAAYRQAPGAGSSDEPGAAPVEAAAGPASLAGERIRTDGARFRAFFQDEATWAGDALIVNLDLRINGLELDPIKPDTLQIAELGAHDEVVIIDGLVEQGDRLVSLQEAFVGWLAGR